MNIVIPMAGFGQRFLNAGYTVPKPLIPVEGRPMIEHVIDFFPGEENFTFICKNVDLQETPMREILLRAKPTGRILGIDAEKKGPVHGMMAVKEELAALKGPTTISYCDFGMPWVYADFKRLTETGIDGAIVTYTGFQPHLLGSTHYAFVRMTADGRVLEVREKSSFTNERMKEHCSNGIYYFRDSDMMLHYLGELIAQNRPIGGEFYASLPFNLMIRDGLDVRAHNVPTMLQWGIPEDLEEYVLWSDFFRHRGQRLAPAQERELKELESRIGDLDSRHSRNPPRTSEDVHRMFDHWQPFFAARYENP